MYLILLFSSSFNSTSAPSPSIPFSLPPPPHLPPHPPLHLFSSYSSDSFSTDINCASFTHGDSLRSTATITPFSPISVLAHAYQSSTTMHNAYRQTDRQTSLTSYITRSFTHSLIRSLTHALTLSLTHSLTHSVSQSVSQSLGHHTG